MILSLLLKGFIIGFAIAMPVGPNALLCIKSSLSLGKWGGYSSGFGASVGDSFFALMAGLGVAEFNRFLETHALAFNAIGALCLTAIGIGIILGSSSLEKAEKALQSRPIRGILYAAFTALVVTLVNPLAIVSFASVFAAFGTNLVQVPGLTSAFAIAFGVFLGSLAWWMILSSFTVWLKKRMEPKHIRWMNIISGTFIILLGLGTLVTKIT